ncbi:MAG: hypothetical protein U9P11_05095, partial [Pseudomonadota bacterium]|nr:hypothetical protein [Pseudomonadota bacterium]
KRRGREERERQASRYLEHLDAIWELQSWLLGEADKAGIAIIQNWYIEDTVREILELAIRRIMEHFPPQPDTDVWGNSS